MNGSSASDLDLDLDRAFAALADPVRRAMIARLSRGPATVNELAEPFEVSKQAVSRHIHVLEVAGLVSRTRDAQRRPVHLEAERLELLTAWIDRYRLLAEQRYRSLDAVLAAAPSRPRRPDRADARGTSDDTDLTERHTPRTTDPTDASQARTTERHTTAKEQQS